MFNKFKKKYSGFFIEQKKISIIFSLLFFFQIHVNILYWTLFTFWPVVVGEQRRVGMSAVVVYGFGEPPLNDCARP